MPPLLYFEPKLGRAYAFHPRSGGVFELMPDEYEVLVRKDPLGQYRALIDEMLAYSGPKHTVDDFIGHLTSIGILNDRLSFPVKIILELTNRCNLRCKHCYLSAGDPLPDELPHSRWLSLIEEVSSYAVQVVLTGGEPFVYPNLLDLLVAIKNHGLAVKILTNGTLLSSLASDLSQLLDPRVDSIQVSLDGMRETHDSIRGEGSFDRAVEGIKSALSAGIPVDIAYTVISSNRSDALPLYRFVASLGVRSFRVSWGVPLGRLDSAISFSSFLDLVEALKEESRSFGLPVSYESFSDLPVDPRSVYSCPAGVSQVFITATGDVLPCPIFRFPPFVFGNVRESPLLSIWQKPDWKKLKRNLSGTKCDSCPLFLSCRGGCPARAYLVSGDLNAPGPDCRKEY